MLNKKITLILMAIVILATSGIMVAPAKAFTTFPTSSACTASGGVMGDLNHDTQVNELDVVVAQHIFSGLEPYTACGDFDGDGTMGPGEISQITTLSNDIAVGNVTAPITELWENSFYNPYRIPACQTVFGDVNGDLKADYQDASIIQYMFAGKLPFNSCGDTDGNGFADPQDIAVSQGISVGITYPHLEKPIITLTAPTQITLEVGTPYTEPGATAYDTQDLDLTSSIIRNPAVVNTSVPGGPYLITYNVTDSDGNPATPRQRQLTVEDTTLPVITLLGANPQAIARGNAYVELGATATDNYDGDISGTITIDASAVNTAVAGSYTVTYNVSDSSVNAAVQVTRTVSVLSPSTGGGGGDTTPPTNLSLTINNGAQITNNQTVNLALHAEDFYTPLSMMISNSADFSGSAWENYATAKSWELTANEGNKTVYAKFKDASGNVSEAVSDSITLVPGQVPVDEEGEVLGEVYVAPGTLIKRADISSVYFVGEDNLRHAFPNESVFFSYYPDFSQVQTVSADTLAGISLGSNVTMNPGTWLVKIQSDPKVYAVEPSGVLRWVSSAQIADSLYGNNWGTKIVDIEPTFFINYQLGSDIDTASHPTGQLFAYQGDDSIYYVEQGQKRLVSPTVFMGNNFQSKFVIQNVSLAIVYDNGLDMPSLGMEVIMVLR